MNRKIATKPHLEEQRGQSDCGHHHQSDWTIKGIWARIDNDQSQRQDKQPRGDHRPTTHYFGLGLGRRLELGSGHRPISSLFRILLLYLLVFLSALGPLPGMHSAGQGSPCATRGMDTSDRAPGTQFRVDD
jgi:hypothetical protein